MSTCTSRLPCQSLTVAALYPWFTRLSATSLILDRMQRPPTSCGTNPIQLGGSGSQWLSSSYRFLFATPSVSTGTWAFKKNKTGRHISILRIYAPTLTHSNNFFVGKIGTVPTISSRTATFSSRAQVSQNAGGLHASSFTYFSWGLFSGTVLFQTIYGRQGNSCVDKSNHATGHFK